MTVSSSCLTITWVPQESILDPQLFWVEVKIEKKEGWNWTVSWRFDSFKSQHCKFQPIRILLMKILTVYIFFSSKILLTNLILTGSMHYFRLYIVYMAKTSILAIFMPNGKSKCALSTSQGSHKNLEINFPNFSLTFPEENPLFQTQVEVEISIQASTVHGLSGSLWSNLIQKFHSLPE